MRLKSSASWIIVALVSATITLFFYSKNFDFLLDCLSERNVTDLIESQSYPFEEHTVQTEDGYVLSLQRIPYGRNEASHRLKSGSREVVLLVHGMLAASESFLLNQPEDSLGFILADAGYDVWLVNHRGNKYSMTHIKYTSKDKQFWDFSFDEMAKYDLPAIIDYILKETRREDLFYIGTSQGSGVIFALLSEQPEYNKKIKLNFALCPGTYVGQSNETLRHIAVGFMHLVNFFGSHGLLADTSSRWFARAVCKIFPIFCLEVMGGSEIVTESKFRYVLNYFPSGTSTRAMAHYGQNSRSKLFSKYDFGRERNLIHYGQPTPPEYNLSTVTAPSILMWSIGDKLITPSDVFVLMNNLQCVVSSYKIPNHSFSHIDFMIGLKAKEVLYDEILRLLQANRNASTNEIHQTINTLTSL